tara:strand:- start:5596 stop:5829 length:234 start_codon:yes stop_codon:yes gene_type:complete
VLDNKILTIVRGVFECALKIRVIQTEANRVIASLKYILPDHCIVFFYKETLTVYCSALRQRLIHGRYFWISIINAAL